MRSIFFGGLHARVDREANGFPPMKFALGTLAMFAALPASNAMARTTPIDVNTSQAWGDADDGQQVNLASPVNYGTGAQSSVTVHFGAEYQTNWFHLDPVSLTFGNSASDMLFATLMAPTDGAPVVMVSSPGEDTSSPNHSINPASIFNFGDMYTLHPDGSHPITTNMGALYGPFSGSAEFQFIDLSSSGSPGDFELLLTCNEMCTNIGFSLGGLDFSAANFDPASAPSQLQSYTGVTSPGPGLSYGSWDFVFRNPSSVPEPATWGSMVLGFALLGGAVGRRRKKERHAA